MPAASCRAPRTPRKPDGPSWRNAAQCSKDARQRAPAGKGFLSCQSRGHIMALQLDLSAQWRANEHLTVFAQKRQSRAYHGHMVGGERLWTDADVDATIAAAPDFVGSVISGEGLKGIVEA